MSASLRLMGSSLFAALLLLTGCDGSSPTEPEGDPQPLPTSLWMTGSARSVEADGTSVSCELELRFDLTDSPRQSPGVLEYDGVHGGSILRTVLDAQGNGIALWPDVFGSAIVRSIAPDQLQITIPANVQADGRFWRELAQFEGTISSDGTMSGGWTCAPFDIDSGGYVDTMYLAEGTWTLAPVGI